MDEGYGRFGSYSRVEMERFFHLDDEDHKLIAARRRDYNRLGYAVQMITVRHLGTFLPDPLNVPAELVEYLAGQLGIEDPACLNNYTDRRMTRFEHQAEIQHEYGLSAFADVETELATWIADQAWMTGDGPKVIFGGAVAWLRKRQALLPGITRLEKLVATGREVADKRLWSQLAGRLGADAASALLALLDMPIDGKQRITELERLRKGVFRSSSKGLLAAVNRLADLIIAVGGTLDVSAVPPRRLAALATYGLSSKAAQLRRIEPREHRLAVLVATVKVLSGRATDDVLEMFDLLMVTDLFSKTERESKEEKLRRYPRVSRFAGKLAAAVRVLLEMTEVKPDWSLEMMWDHIENSVTKSELLAAVAVIDELVPVDDAELNGQRLEELAGRLATVRIFLPPMMRVVEFGATTDGAPTLAAMKTLAELMTAKTKLPASWLDARKVDHDLIGGGWKRLVYREGRPDETVDRAAYTLCLLEQFHRHLKHRNIFAPHSSRWRDPRAHLLSGQAWEQTRETGMNALSLPSDPGSLLAEHATALDIAYREVASRLGGDGPATVDENGKLHLAALKATPDPESLVDLRRRTEAMLPEIDLPELVLEVMSWVPGFTEAFTHASGNEARVADLGMSVAAVLCAHAMNVGFKPVTSPGVEALTRDRLHHVDQHYVRLETLAKANVALINAQADVPLARTWGGGLLASVDGIRFVVPVRSIHSRPSPKFVAPQRGITWLNMLNDQAAGLAGLVVRGTPRDSLNFVDVLFSQRGGTVPEAIITDTGSRTGYVR